MDRQIALQQHAGSELPPVERGELERHLQSCAACRADLETYRALLAGLAEMPAVEPPADLHAQLMSTLAPYREALRVRRESRTLVLGRRILGLGFGCAFGVALVASLWGWVGRILTFTGRSFSHDLVPLWEAVRDLWYLLQLLVDVARILRPAAGNLWSGMLQAHQTALQFAPLVFAAYGALLCVGGWLCWRALYPAQRRRWNHAS